MTCGLCGGDLFGEEDFVALEHGTLYAGKEQSAIFHSSCFMDIVNMEKGGDIGAISRTDILNGDVEEVDGVLVGKEFEEEK